MSIMTTMPVTCRHCGEEIRERDGVWVDVRLSSEGGTGDLCIGPYASHLPEREPGNIPYF